LDSICPTPPDKIAGVMGYLIEIDPLRSHIAYPKPEPDAPEIQEAPAPAEVLEEETPDCQQKELNFVLP
jgi:hypothetical protein